MMTDRGKAARCHDCGTTIVPGVRFCSHCGAKVADRSAEERPDVGDLGQDLSSLAVDLEQLKRGLKGDKQDLRGSLQAERERLKSGLDDFRRSLRADRVAGPGLRPLAEPRIGQGRDSGPAPSVGPPVPDLAARQTDMQPGALFSLARVTMQDLEVRVRHQEYLNYSLMAAGLPLIDFMEIESRSAEDLRDVLIKAWVAGGYTETWETTIGQILAYQDHRLTGISVPVHLEKLRDMREARKAQLRIEVLLEDRKVFSQAYPLEIHAFNEWKRASRGPQGLVTLALFVTPNSPAVTRIKKAALAMLKEEQAPAAFEGYQSEDPQRVHQIARAIYRALTEELSVHYSMPPASFEAMGQKIRSAAEVLDSEMGTCLDLAILLASCFEGAGLLSVIFVVQGHAFTGLWLEEIRTRDTVIEDVGFYTEAVAAGRLIAIEATCLTSATDYDTAVQMGASNLRTMPFEGGVEMGSCRNAGIKPVDEG